MRKSYCSLYLVVFGLLGYGNLSFADLSNRIPPSLAEQMVDNSITRHVQPTEAGRAKSREEDDKKMLFNYAHSPVAPFEDYKNSPYKRDPEGHFKFQEMHIICKGNDADAWPGAGGFNATFVVSVSPPDFFITTDPGVIGHGLKKRWDKIPSKIELQRLNDAQNIRWTELTLLDRVAGGFWPATKTGALRALDNLKLDFHRSVSLAGDFDEENIFDQLSMEVTDAMTINLNGPDGKTDGPRTRLVIKNASGYQRGGIRDISGTATLYIPRAGREYRYDAKCKTVFEKLPPGEGGVVGEY